MKFAVLQPEYPASADSAPACMAWMDAQLAALNPGQADLVLLPEFANAPGITDRAALRQCAETHGAAFLENVAASAQRLGCLVAVGAAIREDDQWFNRTLVYDASGEIVFHYDKIHLPATESRDLGLTAGSVSPVFEYPGTPKNEDPRSIGGMASASSAIRPEPAASKPDRAEPVPPPPQARPSDRPGPSRPLRIGFATCFDLYFPEHFVALAAQSVDLILCPSYQRSESANRIRLIAQARAFDTGCHLARSSYAMPTPDHGGHSLIAAPDGRLLADAGNTAGIITTEFDPAQKLVKPASHGQPPVEHRALIESHRRPETYRD